MGPPTGGTPAGGKGERALGAGRCVSAAASPNVTGRMNDGSEACKWWGEGGGRTLQQLTCTLKCEVEKMNGAQARRTHRDFLQSHNSLSQEAQGSGRVQCRQHMNWSECVAIYKESRYWHYEARCNQCDGYAGLYISKHSPSDWTPLSVQTERETRHSNKQSPSGERLQINNTSDRRR